MSPPALAPPAARPFPSSNARWPSRLVAESADSGIIQDEDSYTQSSQRRKRIKLVEGYMYTGDK